MLLRMIGGIRASRPVWMRFCRLSLRHGGVLGIGRLVVSLFRLFPFAKSAATPQREIDVPKIIVTFNLGIASHKK